MGTAAIAGAGSQKKYQRAVARALARVLEMLYGGSTSIERCAIAGRRWLGCPPRIVKNS